MCLAFPGIHDVCWEWSSWPTTSWLGWVYFPSLSPVHDLCCSDNTNSFWHVEKALLLPLSFVPVFTKLEDLLHVSQSALVIMWHMFPSIHSAVKVQIYLFFQHKRGVWIPMTECILSTTTPRQRSGRTPELKGELNARIGKTWKLDLTKC